MIIPGTIIGYILGHGRGSGGGTFYFALLLSSSRMHTLSTYALITFTLIQGNMDYIIMIDKFNIRCMDKSGKI